MKYSNHKTFKAMQHNTNATHPRPSFSKKMSCLVLRWDSKPVTFCIPGRCSTNWATDMHGNIYMCIAHYIDMYEVGRKERQTRHNNPDQTNRTHSIYTDQTNKTEFTNHTKKQIPNMKHATQRSNYRPNNQGGCPALRTGIVVFYS